MVRASDRVWRGLVWALLAGLAGGCAGGPGDRLSGVAYSGDIDPTVPRPMFAQIPPVPRDANGGSAGGPPNTGPADAGPSSDGSAVAEPRVRDAVGRSEPAPPAAAPVPPVDVEPLPPPAVPDRAGAADADRADPVDAAGAAPEEPPPATAPEEAAVPEAAGAAATAPAETDPFVIEGSVDEVLTAAGGAGALAAGAPHRSDFRLNSGATSLSADELAALAELSRRQARLGGTVRLVVYRPANAGEAGAGLVERSRARAQAMADALVQLGVDPARIDIAETDAPAGGSGPAGGAAGAGPRVYLDRADTSG